MLIRSQNGEVISNIQSSPGLCVGQAAIRGENSQNAAICACANDGDAGLILGIYENSERCKEIIADICEQYQRFVNFPGAEGNAVFQMPEE